MVRNPAGLYGGGAFLVDTKPVFNLLAKKQAQEEAKKTALTKYFSGLVKDTDPSKIRKQEQPAYLQAVKNFKDYYTQNSNDILSGNIEKQMKVQELANMASKIAGVGKDLKTNDLTIADITLKGGGMDMWTDPVKSQWDVNEQSAFIIDPKTGEVSENPTHKKLEVTGLAFNPKLKTEAEMDQDVDKVLGGIKPDVIKTPAITKHPTDPYSLVKTSVKEYSPEKLKAMGNSLGLQYDQDPSTSFSQQKYHPFKEMNDEKIAQLSKENALFKSIYGRDMSNDKDLYVGTHLWKKTESAIEKEIIPNKAYIEAQEEARQKRVKAFGQKGEEGVFDINQFLPGIDSVPDGTYSTEAGGSVLARSGRWYNPDGTIYKGESAVIVPKLPAEVTSKVPTEDFKKLAIIKGGKYFVKDGVAQTVETAGKGGTMSRVDFVSESERKKMNKVPKTENIKVPSTPKKAKDKYGF